MDKNYAPQCRDTKWSWKKQGTFELRVTTGHRPPWMDVKTLRAAQASGSTLEWDLRSRPVLWRSVELWAWGGNAKPDNPKQATLFAVDRQDPLSHLDMADYLGEAKLIYMAADCTDQYGGVDEPTTFIYTLALWFSIDIEKVFFGEQGEKVLQRRKLLWALGERNAGWLTLGYVEQEKPLGPQAGLDLDDDDELEARVDKIVDRIVEAAPPAPLESSIQAEVLAKVRTSGFTCRKCGDGGMIAVDDRGVTVCFKCSTEIAPDSIDAAISAKAAADQAQATLANQEPASNVYELKPKAKPVKRDLVSEMRKLLQPVLDKRADAIAAELEVTEEDVVKAAREDQQFETRRFRPFATTSMVSMVSLKNLALRPMFEDPEIEAERLEACRSDMARHAAACLADAHATYVAEGHDGLIRSGAVDGRVLANRVAAVMDAGDISAQLYQALMDRPSEFKLVDARGVAVERMSHGLVSPARWIGWVVSPAQNAVVAQESEETELTGPDSGLDVSKPIICSCTMFEIDRDTVIDGVRHSWLKCEQLEVKMPDFDAPEPVEVRMAKMDARILNAMVESLRNASFDRAAHNVAYDCNTSVTCTTEDVVRIASANPETFVVSPRRQGETGPARIELISNPTQDVMRATIEGWLQDAVGQRMGKGEVSTRIQEHWKLKGPSIGRAWLDLAMRGNPRLVDLNAKGIGLASAWGPAQED